MSEENQNNQGEVTTSTTTENTTSQEAEAVQSEPAATTSTAKQRRIYTIIAVGVVLVLFAGLLYVMETTGRINTGLFSGFEQAQLERQVVAEVNDETITAYDLSVSQEQIAAAAGAQGVDVADPATAESIRVQAIEMLINTELLRQEAVSRGLEVSDEDVAARYDQLVSEVGREEVLFARMDEFGVNADTLQKDIKNELTIQVLLDQVFSESTIEVSDEEIAVLYETAGGSEGGLPPIAEVEEQIRAQIEATKEQEVVTSFVENLREESEVNILIEV